MKLIIWDLDETLWEGTIYYGEDVSLKPEAKEILKQLDKLGIKQAVCTHNKFIPAVKKIGELGLTKYFKVVKASTGMEKDEMIKQILKELNILPEETLFIDDTVFNRELVREVVGCHVDYETDLYQIMKYFDTERLVLMNQQRNRNNSEQNWSGTKTEFLKTINNEISIKVGEESEIPRLTILTNRTNELNATQNRYTEAEIEKFIKDKSYIVYVAYLRDKFGSYGLIGEVIIEKQDNMWFLKDVCVSCRTMGRGIGSALFRHIKQEAEKNCVEILKGVVIPNEDNFRMTHLFEKFGFNKTKEEDRKIYYELKCCIT